MTKRVLLATTLLILPSMAAAQQPPADQQQQILQLLQGMNTKFDTIEKRLDKIEGQASDASAAKPDAPAQQSSAPEAEEPQKPEVAAVPSGVATPGWKIDVMPYGKDGPGDAPIARTRAPIGKTYLNMHMESGPVSNYVEYRATAFFWARESGTYSFKIYLDQSSGSASLCDLSLKVEDHVVLSDKGLMQPQSTSGNIDLQEGKYLLTTYVGCYRANHAKDRAMDGYEVQNYKGIFYDVAVLGPSDSQMRPFEPDELFFIAPPQRVKAKPQALSAAPALQYQQQAAPVDEDPTEQIRAVDISRPGITTGNANLRSEPSREAGIVMKVGPRASLLVMQQLGDWYKVQTAGGASGFLHNSLVAIME